MIGFDEGASLSRVTDCPARVAVDIQRPDTATAVANPERLDFGGELGIRYTNLEDASVPSARTAGAM
jgi:hypothetical protein